jgi:MFS family permease
LTEHAGDENRHGWREIASTRPFSSFLIGNLTSNCGMWMHTVAAAVIVYDISRSALLVGVISGLQHASVLALSPLAGSLADRFGGRVVLLSGQVLACAAAGCLALWSLLQDSDRSIGLWPLVVATTAMGIGNAVSSPVLIALVPSLVRPVDLQVAVSLNSTAFVSARAIGPALAAAALAVGGADLAFAANTLSYVPLLIVLSRMPPQKRASSADTSVRAGIRYTARRPVIAVALLAAAGIGYGADPAISLAPVMVTALDMPTSTVGWLTMSFGGGAILGASLAALLSGRLGPPRSSALGIVLMGAATLGLVWNIAPGPTFAAMALVGLGFQMASVGLVSIVHLAVDDAFRARVIALWMVCFLGARPLAGLVNGSLVDSIGLRYGLLISLGVTLALAAPLLASRRRNSRSRHKGRS